MIHLGNVEDFDPKTKFSASSEVLQRLFEDGKSPLSGPFLRWKLWMKWREVVGDAVADSTEPVGYRRGCLWLWVKNSSWMQQMVFMREDIRETINRKMGVEFVQTLRFTLDRREVPKDGEDQEEIRRMIGKFAPENDGE